MLRYFLETNDKVGVRLCVRMCVCVCVCVCARAGGGGGYYARRGIIHSSIPPFIDYHAHILSPAPGVPSCTKYIQPLGAHPPPSTLLAGCGVRVAVQ